MSWADRARTMIASIEMTLSPRPDLKEMRKILRGEAIRFHGGTSWGKKIWARESRLHLERHYGAPLRNPPPDEPVFRFPDDISFPWRKA